MKKIIDITRAGSLTISASPVIIAGIIVQKFDMTSILLLFGCLLTAVFLQISANIANDYFDWQKCVDNENSLKYPSSIITGEVKPCYYKYACIGSTAIGIAIGLAVCFFSEWKLVFLGIASVLAVVWYSAGSVPLSFRGLGEISAFVFFGIVPCCGTYYVLTSSISTLCVSASVMCGLFASAIMAVNNLRDIRSDLKAGKKTIAVMLGEAKARNFTILLLSVSFISPLPLVLFGRPLLFLALIPEVFLIRELYVLRWKPISGRLNTTIANISIAEFVTVLLICFLWAL